MRRVNREQVDKKTKNSRTFHLYLITNVLILGPANGAIRVKKLIQLGDYKGV